jgi:hypothetical protein
MGESSGSVTSDNDSSRSTVDNNIDEERAFQSRCTLRSACTEEQRAAVELQHEAKSKGLLVTGKRNRQQAKAKSELAVEESPETRGALLADVGSEVEEALVETESDSDDSADRPGGHSDDEDDHTCSCEHCDMPSESWQGDEPRCAQCVNGCECKCEGCSKTGRSKYPRANSVNARAVCTALEKMQPHADAACSCSW